MKHVIEKQWYYLESYFRSFWANNFYEDEIGGKNIYTKCKERKILLKMDYDRNLGNEKRAMSEIIGMLIYRRCILCQETIWLFTNEEWINSFM
jgi:hypothetical protein